MRDLLVIVPTRGRPPNAARLAEQLDATCLAQTDVCFRLDDDDPVLDDYRQVLNPQWVTVGPRVRLGPSLNEVAAARAADYRAVGFLGDDHYPHTAGWDTLLLAALEKVGGGVAYGNDLVHGPALPTAVVMSSLIPVTLGWMAPPGLLHLFLDDSWRALGQGLKRLCYLADVVIQHLHPIAGTAPMDQGYAEVNSSDMWSHDETRYREWVTGELATDLARLRAAGLGSVT